MKKFLSVIILFVAAMMINLSVSQARQVRVADVGAENFVAQLKQILYSNDFRQFLKNDSTFNTVIYPILTDVVRDRNFDFPDRGLTAWSCYCGREDSVKADGQIIFSTDSSGYVFEILMIFPRESSSAQVGAHVLNEILSQINLTNNETGTLFKIGHVWSSYNSRVYAMNATCEEYETWILLQAFDS